MSPAAREADSRWIGELWQNYLNTVAANRQIPAQQVFPGAQVLLEGLTKTGGDTAKYALENKLVDALASSAEIKKALTKEFGWSKTDKNYRAISYYDQPLKRRQIPVTASVSSSLMAQLWMARKLRGMLAVIPLRHKSATLALTRK